jgi:hypothetical protein
MRFASMIMSAMPSPLTSPAEATDQPLRSPDASPESLKPVVPSSVERSRLAAKAAAWPRPTHTLQCRSWFPVTRLKRKSGAPVFGNQDAIAQRSSPGLASNRSTVKPLSPPPRHTCMVQAEHPSPSAGQFRLLPHGLAISELRRMVGPKRGSAVLR